MTTDIKSLRDMIISKDITAEEVRKIADFLTQSEKTLDKFFLFTQGIQEKFKKMTVFVQELNMSIDGFNIDRIKMLKKHFEEFMKGNSELIGIINKIELTHDKINILDD